MTDVRLSISNLCKSYNDPVLKNVDLSLRRGEIRGLVGENGAGKSTLVNVLAGLVRRDSGGILLDGEPHQPASAAEGFAAGISFTSQEGSIIGTLSVAENIFLRELPQQRGIVDRERLAEEARVLLGRIGLQNVATDAPADSLSLAEQQLVELAKAIHKECRLLLLDEPTAALTEQQADRIHAVIRDLAASGVTVVYISHRLGDVLAVADTVTVLRDGAVVSTNETDATTADELVAIMSGGVTPKAGDRSAVGTERRKALAAENLTTAELPNPIDLACDEGEIVGIAGLAGAGKSELLQALFGLQPLFSGSVVRYVDGEPVRIQSARHAVRHGIAFLGENRQASGVFPGQSVLANMMLPDILRTSVRTLDKKKEQAAGYDLVDRLAIRCDSLRQDIRQLSGGNQQKVLLARWLNAGSAVMLLDEPTRGVDVATKQAIYELLFELRAKGNALIVASSELEELMSLSDRIVVLSNRSTVAEFERDNWSEETILSASFSAFTDKTAPDQSSAGLTE